MPSKPEASLTHLEWQRALGGLCLLGCLLFGVTTLTLQWLRADLNWLQVPLSFYLIGPYASSLTLAYVAMAASFVLLGAGHYLAQATHQRSLAPLLLLTLAALGLVLTTLADTPVAGEPVSLHGLVHGIAAKTAFLCVTCAQLLQSSYWRRAAPASCRDLWALAWLCFVGLWFQALPSGIPHGLNQKLLIALILLWQSLAAWRLLRGTAHGRTQAA